MNAKQGGAESVQPVDEVERLLDRLEGLLGAVDGRLAEAGDLLDKLEVIDAEIARLASGSSGSRPTNNDLNAEGAQGRRKEALVSLATAILELCREAGEYIVVAHNLAASERNSTLFYAGPSPVVFAPTSTSNEVASKAETLGSITHAAISNADATRELNRLLDHASAKRIAEEMDIVTYQAQAARLFERIRTEFSDVSREFAIRAARMDTHGLTLEVGQKPSSSARLRSIADRLRQVDGLPDEITPFEAVDQFEVACKWLRRYGKFMKYAKASADRMANDFASEASVEIYKDATRPHAKRIEQQGLLLVSKQTLGMGLAAAVAVAVILIFINNNLVMKNWAIPLVGLSATLMYILAIKFGHDASGGHMRDLRNTLLARALDILNPFGATAVSEALTEESFQFPKIEWQRFQAGDATAAKPHLQRGVLAKTFADVSRRKWFLRRRRMALSNAAALALMVALLLALSWPLGSPLNRGSFSFVSQTAEYGACELDRGHLLLATGGNYYLISSRGNHVTEIAKSLVWQIRPVNAGAGDHGAASGGSRDDPPDCAKLAVAPTTVSFASPLQLQQDPSGLTAAASVVAASIEGLGSLAAKLTPSEGSIAACGSECVTALTELSNSADRVATNIKGLRDIVDKLPPTAEPICAGTCPKIETSVTFAPLPVVIPMVVETAPADGPTFITQLYVVDKLMTEFGGNRLIVLPLFPGPVASDKALATYGSDGIDTPQEAYYFGLTSMANPVLPNDDKTLLDYVQNSMKSCINATQAAFKNEGHLGDAPRLRLSVRGYANEKWTASSVSDDRKEVLNWYLAEGRRQAVINALEIADHDLIEVVPKATALSFGGPEEVDLEKLVQRFQFDGYKSMKKSLEGWLVPPISADDKRYVKEIFAKSVVIEVESDVIDHCGAEWRSVDQR